MHDRRGDWLYGTEVCVDPERRRLRIGKRLYDARRRLCQDLDLKGIAFGGRMPGYKRHQKKYGSADAYLEAIKANEVKDPVASFHLNAGFEPIRLLKNYYPTDTASGGYGVLMVWRNPYYDPIREEQPVNRSNPDVVRVVTVQMKARQIEKPDDFYKAVEYFVEVAADYDGDFVVFPELFTLMLLSCEPEELKPEAAIQRLTEHTPEFVKRLTEMAIRRNINIIGGSHATKTEDGDIQNVGYVFLRDGSVHAREKIHPTPNERQYWQIKGGDPIDTIETDCGPIGIMICYDSEFPEVARRLSDQGARILFVPFNTDTRHGYLQGPLLLPGAGDREPVLCRDVRHDRQSRQCRQSRHRIRPVRHLHALRLPLRPRRHRGRSLGECRDGRRRRPQPLDALLGALRGLGQQLPRPPAGPLPDEMVGRGVSLRACSPSLSRLGAIRRCPAFRYVIAPAFGLGDSRRTSVSTRLLRRCGSFEIG